MTQKCTIPGCGRECEFYACWDCINDTIRLLRELELYVADMFPAMRQKLRGEPGRGAPGYGSRSPGRDDIIIALDPRSKPGSVDEDGNATTRRPDDAPRWIRSIPASISAIADWVATEKGEHPRPPSTFVQDMGYVRRSLPWCAQQATRDDDGKWHPWINDTVSDIKELHHQARWQVRDQPQPPLGTCLSVGCEGDVYWTNMGAQCRGCSRRYDGLDLVRLGAAQEAS